jgi:serine/threonine-protein kinase
MLYESVTGVAPFTGSSVSIMAQHASTRPTPPRIRNPDISENLDAFILLLLAKRAEDRPRSASTVAKELRREVDQILQRPPDGASATTSPTIPTASSGTMATSAVLTERQPMTAPVSVEAKRLGSRSAVSLPEARPSAAKLEVQQGRDVVEIPAEGTALQIGAGEITSRASAKPAEGSTPRPTLVMASVTSTGGVTALVSSRLVRLMLEVVLAEPARLTPEERYLHGHYLAYLLSGSRRRGLLLRRPLEPRNADRGRLLLGLTYAILAGATDEAIRTAASLLDERIEVRAALSPVVVAKYLACRASPGQRRIFRQTRRAIAEASTYARKQLIDANGVLNPGLMPQRLEDLYHLAPPRTEVDDVLVERWNRVAEVWRDQQPFRKAVLRYATSKAHRDPASAALWPEVVYPLIERARWHRRIRSRTEALWDYLCAKVIRLPDAGVELDRALDRAVPAPLVAQLDDSLDLMIENPRLDDEEADPFLAPDDDRFPATISVSQQSLAEIAEPPVEADRNTGRVRLAHPDPLRFLQGQLHDLWKEALAAMQQRAQTGPGTKTPTHRVVPVGPYRLTVIPSIRGRTAGQIAIQGMANKQIELTTPAIRIRGSAGRPILAIWVYCDNSLVISHLDFVNNERYVLWHAPKSHQLNYDDPADLNHELFTLDMDIPDQVDKVLSRRFKPKNQT